MTASPDLARSVSCQLRSAIRGRSSRQKREDGHSDLQGQVLHAVCVYTQPCAHAGWYVCTGVGCHVQITTERVFCQPVRSEAMATRLGPDPNGNCLGQRMHRVGTN